MTARPSPLVRAAEGAPAPLLVIGSIISVQSGAALATGLFPAVGPGGAVWLRLLLSGIVLLAITRPRVRSFSRRALGLALVYGLVLAGMNATFYASLHRIPLGVAVTVEFLGPLAVAVVGSRRLLDLVWVAAAIAGVVLLAGTPGRLDHVGLALAAVAGACWAAYILVAQRVGQVIPGVAGLALALGVGAVVLVPYGVLSGGRHLLRAGVLGRGLAIAVLSSLIPYSLELAALRRLRAAVFGVLMSLEPAVAALCGLVFLGQHLLGREWVAVGCVMAASIGATRGQREVLTVEPEVEGAASAAAALPAGAGLAAAGARTAEGRPEPGA